MIQKNRYSTVLHFHTAFLLFDEKSWIQCQNMLYESASCIWMTIAISFLDPLIFHLLFFVNCSIFLHIFFPCYLFKTICFFIQDRFFFFTKSRCMPFAKKKNASSWKLQRKSLTTFFVMVNKRLFSVEWINHTNNHNGSKQMSNSLNF